jgi:excinuclease ABC subunit C
MKVMALAKKENKLFVEGKENPILLKSLPREIFNLILQLRDEAHRFALTYHKKLREKDLFGSY